MGTWILIKGIPPDLFGINPDRWKREQSTILWSKKQIKTESLSEAKRRGSKILEEREDITLVDEPSKKEDTANDIWDKTPSRAKIDYKVLSYLLEIFGLDKGQVEESSGSYYSSKFSTQFSGFVVRVNPATNMKEIKNINETFSAGTQLITFRLGLRNLYDGISTISYIRNPSGSYQYEGSVLGRKNEESVDKSKLLQTLGLPTSFELPEEEIKGKLAE